MTSTANTIPARPIEQILCSAFGAVLFGWALPVAAIATLFQI